MYIYLYIFLFLLDPFSSSKVALFVTANEEQTVVHCLPFSQSSMSL